MRAVIDFCTTLQYILRLCLISRTARALEGIVRLPRNLIIGLYCRSARVACIVMVDLEVVVVGSVVVQAMVEEVQVHECIMYCSKLLLGSRRAPSRKARHVRECQLRAIRW